MATHSCIYEGIVVHRRTEPIDRTFRYSLLMMYVDLEELPQLFKGRWLWSSDRPAVARFRRADYMGSPNEPLSHSVRSFVASQTGRRLTGPVRLLTQFRHFGYVFNPLSLYYCFDENGELAVIVAEVSNTPWGERHRYVIQSHPTSDSSRCVEASAIKQLHVSPFLEMHYEYSFRLSKPGESLRVQIANWPRFETANTPVFVADLSLKRRELSGANLSRALVLYPFMTQRIIAAIYWQALKLWWRGVPFVPHPSRASDSLPGQESTESSLSERETVDAEK